MKTQKLLPFFTLIVFLLYIPPTTSQANESVMATVSLKPDKTIYVGQRVELSVTVLTDQWFGKAPVFPEFEVPGTLTIKPVNATLNSSERIQGQTYAAQTQPYFIYPQRAEQYTIPPLTVRVIIGRQKEEQTVTTEELTFDVQIPEVAIQAGVQELIATPKLTVKESFDQQPDTLKVGDAFTRTITMTIQDSRAMLLPPLQFEPVEGLGVYPAQPQLTDKADRGDYIGTRVESVTYVMEKPGTYHIPEVTIHWWDTNRGQLKQEILQTLDFTVEKNPDLAAEHLGGDQFEEEGTEGLTIPWGDLTLGEIILLIASIIGVIAFANIQPVRRLMIPWLKRKHAEYVISDAGMLRAFRQACMKGNERAAMNLLMRWLDHHGSQQPIAILERYAAQVNDQEFIRQTERLVNLLYRKAEREGWQGKGLYYSVYAVQGQILPQQPTSKKDVIPKEPVLQLNPEEHQSDRIFKPFGNSR